MRHVTVHVTLKKSVLDPQGKAVEQALHGLGFADAHNVRQGKVIEFDVANSNDPAAVKTQVERMCETLLANTVIEEYTVNVA